ncbi:substrate-binding domain-containing protein [uncultured Bradyrhizobium sp.]|uniref:substrate-binding domain-containing protein n=1 Tax=uncultured Bradyrhizobium sp. TaxID=199684 RepID=UPI00260F8A40|nr:substrate-binding domain-containing protein [uncultured Bradyrhizobium sp.]
MKTQSFAGRLLGTTSLVVLSAAAMIGTQQPAAAQSTISTGIYGGGSMLPSLALRQIFDCYAGTTVANDGQTFSPSFTTAAPSPGLLPASCTMFSTAVEGLFAAVGSGNGQRAYIANDTHQLFRGNPKSAPALVKRPSINPPFRDTANANFSKFPYPQLDFVTSDAPLASSLSSLTTVSFGSFVPTTNWQNAVLIAAKTSAVATYNSAAVGALIQVPVLEVPVAIAVNTSNPVTGVVWSNQSALTPNTQAGGAIQLSAAQLCAIFSATVTDWSDSSTLIPYLDKNGTQQLQHFYDDNTNGALTPVAYTSGHLPIKVVYRSDESGSSFILTNYLANFCPLLDPAGTYNYKAIFTGVGVTRGGTVSTTANLPSSSFINLLENIRAVKGDTNHDHRDSLAVEDDSDRPDPRWISAEGSNHEALKIGTGSLRAGRIGYLSADFTQPYAKTVSEEILGNTLSAPAPLSASIQSQDQRISGVYHPGQAVGGSAQNFVPPTPLGAQIAFGNLNFPAAPATYNDWNIYAQVYGPSAIFGGVSYAGRSVIATPQGAGAYPITGASFLDVYSCYADPSGTRVPALTNWLAWFFGGSQSDLSLYDPTSSNATNPGYDPNVAAIIQNNGLHELDPAWAASLQAQYLLPGIDGGRPTAIAAYRTSGGQVDGCTGVTGGAK